MGMWIAAAVNGAMLVLNVMYGQPILAAISAFCLLLCIGVAYTFGRS